MKKNINTKFTKSLTTLSFILLSLVFIFSCTKPEPTNPYDPNSGHETTPMQGQLVLTQQTDSQVKLHWQLNSSIVGSYIINRKINSGSYELLAEVTSETDEYNDTELLTTNTYNYQVIGANDEVQTEPISNSISTTFAEITAFNIQQQNIFTADITWAHNCNYEEGYVLERREISSREHPLSRGVDSEGRQGVSSSLTLERRDAQLLPDREIISEDNTSIDSKSQSRDFIEIANLQANTIQFTDDTLIPNHIYEYRIVAYTEFNTSSEQLQDFDNTFPAPNNLSCTIENISGTIADVHLDWDYNATGIDGFKIKKNGTLLAEVILAGKTEWIDAAINIGDVITYQVSAFYQIYTSSFSNEVSWEIPAGMIFVLGGTFDMGDHYNEGNPDELPVHSVTLNHFFIGECEVTQAEYEVVVGSNPAHNYGVGDDYPVYYVSWYNAVTFCNLKSQQEGLTPCYNLTNWSCNFTADGYRLPTEAEWEYAARGGVNWTDDYRYSGCHEASDLPNYAWVSSNSNMQTQLVGTKLPNQLDIFDMTGNVWEWCNDWYGNSYYSSSPTNNPTGPSTGSSLVLRGGSWNGYDGIFRVANRYKSNPDYISTSYGLRLVRTP